MLCSTLVFFKTEKKFLKRQYVFFKGKIAYFEIFYSEKDSNLFTISHLSIAMDCKELGILRIHLNFSSLYNVKEDLWQVYSDRA